MLPWLLICLIALATAGFALWERRLRRPSRPVPAYLPAQFVLSQSVFTQDEQTFYEILIGLDLPGVRILAKVRLADIFQARQRQAALRRGPLGAIAQKHVDFLLVRVEDSRPVLGIVLDDCSQALSDRTARDRFVQAVFSNCGLPLLNLPAQHVYTAAAVRRLIYATAPMNFPLSGVAERLANALQPTH